MNILIVDDEESARINLRNKLASFAQQIINIDEANGVQSALNRFQKNEYDLIFLDIQMPDGTGFDFLEQSGNNHSLVAFTTAHNDFALKAFEFAAIGYLLKPIDNEKLAQVMRHASQLKKNYSSQYKLLVESYKTKQIRKLVIPNHEGFLISEISDVLYVKSDGNYSEFYFKNEDKSIISSKTLKEYSSILEPEGFFRVHQSYLINLGFAKEYKKNYNEVILIDGTRIPVARQKRSIFQSIFY